MRKSTTITEPRRRAETPVSRTPASVSSPRPGKRSSRVTCTDALPWRRLSRVDFVFCLSLAIAALAIYSRSMWNPFADRDDPFYVVNNRHIQQGFTPDMLSWAVTSTSASNWHPLTWVSHALDYTLFGPVAAGHHFTSILLHSFNVVLIFLLLLRSTGRRMRSLMVTALFALHPINVESVAWVAERKTVLSMLFFLLAIAAYGWYARRPEIGRYLLVFTLFLFGLASKPMVITLPLVLLLLDFWPLQRVENPSFLNRANPTQASSDKACVGAVCSFPQRSIRNLLAEKLPFLLLIAGGSALTLKAQKASLAFDPRLTVAVRVANALYAYCMYLEKAFWPVHLAPYYPYAGLDLGFWQVLGCLAVLVGISVWVWFERERAYMPVGWLWFLGTMVPMIGIVQVGDQAMADRYAYLPLVGIFFLIVWRGSDWVETWRVEIRWKAVAAAVVLISLAILTWRQIGYWHSSMELWSHTLAVTNDNYVAEDFIGSEFLDKSYEPGGDHYTQDALVHLRNAARINPDDANAHMNIGVALQDHRQCREAIPEFQRASVSARDRSIEIKSLLNLAACDAQVNDPVASRESYNRVLQLDPGDAIAQAGLTAISRVDELAAEAARDPTAGAYLQLGQMQQSLALTSQARDSYQRALQIDPNSYAAKTALEKLPEKTQP